MITEGPLSEMGRELKANELTVKMVVIISREDRPVKITTWVREVGQDYVMFYSGEVKTAFITYIREDGELIDDTGKRIIVNEFLGKV